MGEQEVAEEDDTYLEAHDPNVLPHHYSEVDIDKFFPKAEVGADDGDVFPDFDVDHGGCFTGVR